MIVVVTIRFFRREYNSPSQCAGVPLASLKKNPQPDFPMRKTALCFGFLLCCLPAMSQEQADTATTTRIVKHKSIVCGLFPNHTWVFEVRGKTYGIVEWDMTHSEIVVASRSFALPFSAVALLTMCVFLLCATAIIPTMAVRRKP